MNWLKLYIDNDVFRIKMAIIFLVYVGLFDYINGVSACVSHYCLHFCCGSWEEKWLLKEMGLNSLAVTK